MIHRVSCCISCTRQQQYLRSGSAAQLTVDFNTQVFPERAQLSMMRLSCSQNRLLLLHWLTQQVYRLLHDIAELAAFGRSAAGSACQLHSQ